MRDRTSERVRLVEVPAEERVAILRELRRQAPQRVHIYQPALGSSGDPGSLAAAPRCRVFRVRADRSSP